jgi:DNA-binding CsgD family transcriptional regulator
MEDLTALPPAFAGGPGWVCGAITRAPLLTCRQLAVLDCLAQGMDGRAIARKLRCSERTVKLHTSAVVQRLGVRSRLQAALVGYHLTITGELRLPEGTMPERAFPPKAGALSGATSSAPGEPAPSR